MERDGTAAVSPVRVAAVHFDMQVGRKTDSATSSMVSTSRVALSMTGAP